MLKLAALDDEDLAIISAHVQDAVMKVGQLGYSRSAKQFVLTMNRFAWEAAAAKPREGDERRQSVLSFGRVLSARSHGIDFKAREDVLSLLAIRFVASEAPAGTVELVFAGNAMIRLDVECVEARLADTGGVWRASSRPDHRA